MAMVCGHRVSEGQCEVDCMYLENVYLYDDKGRGRKLFEIFNFEVEVR